MKFTDVNKLQSKYYDEISKKNDSENIGYRKITSANIITKIWAKLRSLQAKNALKNNCHDKLDDFIDDNLDKIENKKILEIGCFSGSPYSEKLIKLSNKYTALELSDNALDQFRQKFKRYEKKIQALNGDFELYEFNDTYDVIYCHGVMHHFKDSDLLINKIDKLLTSEGVIIFTEVSQYCLIHKIARLIYRPFQSDRLWEWPIERKFIERLYSKFSVINIIGWGKYSIFISFIPMFYPMIIAYKYLIKKELNIKDNWGVWKNSTVSGIVKKLK